ncbi:17686_t:CDS:2, partial [Funneliformis geosporum]
KKSANKRAENLMIRRFLSDLIREKGNVTPDNDYNYDLVDDITDNYNARLQSEYIKLNDKNRQLKVENSKLVSQNACTEISLTKAEADNFAKLEKWADSCFVRQKNDISASSVIGTPDSPIEEEKTSDSNSVNSKSNLLEPILPVILANEVSVEHAFPYSVSPRPLKIVGGNDKKDSKISTSKFLNERAGQTRFLLSQTLINYRISTGARRTSSNLFLV